MLVYLKIKPERGKKEYYDTHIILLKKKKGKRKRVRKLENQWKTQSSLLSSS